MKKAFLSLTSFGLLAQVTTGMIEPKKAESPVKVVIEDRDRELIPPIDPEDIELPIDPIIPNQTPELLDILYVSSLDFGTVFLNGEEQIINAKEDYLDSGKTIPPMITIRDYRSNLHRNGWMLTVRYEEDFLDGAEVKMNPFIHYINQTEIGIESGGEISLSTSASKFAETNQSTYATHTISMGMEQPNQPVQLIIPGESYSSGEYNTTLIWELTQGPLNN